MPMLELAKSKLLKRVTERIRLVHCAIQDLPETSDGTFDFVLCHAVCRMAG